MGYLYELIRDDIEKLNEYRKLDFEEQLKKDSNDSIINGSFEIPQESEIGNLEVNK
jgi:hypothetical protein